LCFGFGFGAAVPVTVVVAAASTPPTSFDVYAQMSSGPGTSLVLALGDRQDRAAGSRGQLVRGLAALRATAADAGPAAAPATSAVASAAITPLRIT
jgi:hypothetical protein